MIVCIYKANFKESNDNQIFKRFCIELKCVQQQKTTRVLNEPSEMVYIEPLRVPHTYQAIEPLKVQYRTSFSWSEQMPSNVTTSRF